MRRHPHLVRCVSSFLFWHKGGSELQYVQYLLSLPSSLLTVQCTHVIIIPCCSTLTAVVQAYCSTTTYVVIIISPMHVVVASSVSFLVLKVTADSFSFEWVYFFWMMLRWWELYHVHSTLLLQHQLKQPKPKHATNGNRRGESRNNWQASGTT